MNTDKFNFQISIGQFLIGLLITPIVVSIYLSAEKGQEGSWTAIMNYLSEGSRCVMTFGGAD